MSEPVVIAIIGGLAVILASLITGFLMTLKKQDATYHLVNGRMEELLSVAKELARMQGIDEGEKK